MSASVEGRKRRVHLLARRLYPYAGVIELLAPDYGAGEEQYRLTVGGLIVQQFNRHVKGEWAEAQRLLELEAQRRSLDVSDIVGTTEQTRMIRPREPSKKRGKRGKKQD